MAAIRVQDCPGCQFGSIPLKVEHPPFAALVGWLRFHVRGRLFGSVPVNIRLICLCVVVCSNPPWTVLDGVNAPAGSRVIVGLLPLLPGGVTGVLGNDRFPYAEAE